ncbi:Uncharacterised protein [Enterobacter cloacae]|nr:Uncharacterised protein [Enterobacter cloacae]
MIQVVHQRMRFNRALPGQVCLNVVVKRGRPRVRRVLTVPACGTQVVHHVAAGNQHNAFITQRRQLAAHLQMPGGRFGAVDAELHHRDIRIRIHLNQHAPRAMVKTPGFFIERNRHGCQQLHQPLSQLRRAGSRIVRVVQRLGEAAKIMNGFWRFHGGHARAAGEPVRRHHHDRFRTRQRLAQMAPGKGIDVVFQNVHGATVA